MSDQSNNKKSDLRDLEHFLKLSLAQVQYRMQSQEILKSQKTKYFKLGFLRELIQEQLPAPTTKAGSEQWKKF